MTKYNNLSNGIILSTKDRFYSLTTSISKKIDINCIKITIHLRGDSEYKSLLNNYKMRYQEKQTIIDIINKEEGIVKINTNTHKQFVSLCIPSNFLEYNLPNNKQSDTFFNFFKTKKYIQNISQNTTSPRTQALALEIFNNPYTDNLDKLFIEAKVLELIYTEFTNIFKSTDTKYEQTVKLSSQDKEAIYHARDILVNNLSNPPSMKELAKLVAINELKLKTGFHKYFKTTPYNLLVEYKLQEAKKLLIYSELNINEIAQIIGYKFTSSFTSAFFKEFGILPKDVMKNREI